MSAHFSLLPETSVLADFISRAELGRMLHRSVRTLSRWEAERYGPPVTRFGNSIYYRRTSVLSWLDRREQRFENRPQRGRRLVRRKMSIVPNPQNTCEFFLIGLRSIAEMSATYTARHKGIALCETAFHEEEFASRTQQKTPLVSSFNLRGGVEATLCTDGYDPQSSAASALAGATQLRSARCSDGNRRARAGRTALSANRAA